MLPICKPWKLSVGIWARRMLAMNHGMRGRDAEARQAFDNPLSLNPNDPNVMDDMSRYLARFGDFEAAIALATRLNAIDPGFSGALTNVYRIAGDIDKSVREARRVVQHNSTSHNQRIALAVKEKLAGNEEEARAQAQIAINLRGFEIYDDRTIFGLARDALRYRLLGYDETADRLLDLYFARAERETVSPRAGALAWSALGNYEMVMDNLQLAAEEVESGYRSAGNAPFAANFYDDPNLETPEFIA